MVILCRIHFLGFALDLYGPAYRLPVGHFREQQIAEKGRSWRKLEETPQKCRTFLIPRVARNMEPKKPLYLGIFSFGRAHYARVKLEPHHLHKHWTGGAFPTPNLFVHFGAEKGWVKQTMPRWACQFGAFLLGGPWRSHGCACGRAQGPGVGERGAGLRQVRLRGRGVVEGARRRQRSQGERPRAAAGHKTPEGLLLGCAANLVRWIGTWAITYLHPGQLTQKWVITLVTKPLSNLDEHPSAKGFYILVYCRLNLKHRRIWIFEHTPDGQETGGCKRL